MVKDHSDSEKGNPLPPHRLLFPINSKSSFICTISQTGLHIPTAFVAPVVEYWLEREIEIAYKVIEIIEARCSSVVRAFAHSAMGRQIDPSWGGPIKLFLVPASAPRLV